MNKYNRGTTIVEILLSIIIIGVVLLILFNMLSNVRHEDENNQIQSQYVINQSTFVEKIEEDIINYGVSYVTDCSVYGVDLAAENINPTNKNQFKCLKIEYANSYLVDNTGYVMIYNYYTKYKKGSDNKYVGSESKWMIRYIRGHYDKNNEWHTLNSIMNEMPDSTVLTEKIKVKYTRYNVTDFNNSNAVAINIPIISETGEHYDVNLSFLYQDGFTCDDNSKASSTLECIS